MKTFRMCATRYAGPTDSTGSRVIAKNVSTGKRKVVPWDHALDAHANHARAAIAVLGREPDVCSAVDGGGYIFAVDPNEESTVFDASDFERRWIDECRAHGVTQGKLRAAHHELGEHSLCGNDCEDES